MSTLKSLFLLNPLTKPSSQHLLDWSFQIYLFTYPCHLRPRFHLCLNLSQALVLLRGLNHHLPLGSLARAALHGHPSCLSDLSTRCEPPNYRAAMTPQSVNGKRALLSLRWDPLTIDPSLLPPCLIRRMGPLPPSQLCSCGVCGCFFMYTTECALHKEEGRWNQPLPH